MTKFLSKIAPKLNYFIAIIIGLLVIFAILGSRCYPEEIDDLIDKAGTDKSYLRIIALSLNEIRKELKKENDYCGTYIKKSDGNYYCNGCDIPAPKNWHFK